VSIPALGPTQPHMQRLFPRGKCGRGVKLTTHLRLVQRLRICGGTPPLPQNVFMA